MVVVLKADEGSISALPEGISWLILVLFLHSLLARGLEQATD